MQKNQVAIIDIGSSKISAIVGEKGINKTFVIKLNKQYDYEGFSSGEFFDKDKFCELLNTIANELRIFYHNNLDCVYVGVPGDFTELLVKESQISFPKKKKITNIDVETLFDNAFTLQSANYSLINRSSIVYELDDFRRVANPVNYVSEILKAKLSFVICKNYFIECVEPIIKESGIKKVEFVSMPLAEALYLVDADSRDRLAILLDVGYITTTLSIIQGDGLIYMKSFDYGGGYITASLCDRFSIDFEDAENLKRKANLSSFNKNGDNYDVIEGADGVFYNVGDVKSTIFGSLDSLCESVSNALNDFKMTIPDYVALQITGGGISFLRGAKEHVAGRLNMSVQIAQPQVPLMEKPTMSSILSLLSISLNQV